jgi:hypothetical protein
VSYHKYPDKSIGKQEKQFLIAALESKITGLFIRNLFKLVNLNPYVHFVKLQIIRIFRKSLKCPEKSIHFIGKDVTKVA